MPAATKRRSSRKPTLRSFSHEVSQRRARVEDLEDLLDLNAAIARNRGSPGCRGAKPGPISESIDLSRALIGSAAWQKMRSGSHEKR